MRLNIAIDKFRTGDFNVEEFHSTVESVIKSITEEDLETLRSKLLKFESELEYIDFMVDEKDRKETYLQKIDDLTHWLTKSY